MREGVEKMSADTTAPHLLYNLEYNHKTEPSTSFTPGLPASLNFNDYRDTNRKRKCQIFDDDSDCFDDDDSKSTKTDCDTKSSGSGRPSNHSEIEKRRRDKMNGFITEISALVPTCAAISRKLDKLTVLRLAVQHIKTIRGSSTSYGRESLKPNFITDDELKTMLRKVCDGFLLAVSSDTGKILYVSDNVVDHLGWDQDDLLNQSFVDIVHRKDLPVFKEQMNWLYQSTGNDRIFSQKSSRLTKDSSVGSSFLASSDAGCSIFSSGSKRAFYCRFYNKSTKSSLNRPFVPELEQKPTTNDSNNSQIPAKLTARQSNRKSSELWKPFYCCGFMKSWLQASEVSGDNECDDLSSVSCLIVLARLLKIEPEVNLNLECTLRVGLNGRVLCIDQNFITLTGYNCWEIVGTNFYEYIHDEDLPTVRDSFKKTIANAQKISVQPYRFKSKNETFIKMFSEWSPFLNPWTKEVDFVCVKQNCSDATDRKLSLNHSDKVVRQPMLLDLLAKTTSCSSNVKSNDNKNTKSALSSRTCVETPRSYGSNKSVTISTSEPISDKHSLQKQPYCISDKLLSRTLTDFCSTTSSYRNESTALSVVMNILEAESCLNNNSDYTDMWSL